MGILLALCLLLFVKNKYILKDAN